ncbi:hypothetical protein CCHR01_03516 [Colletotrichum chrysophilum]|uniref:Secreted protein n=1 Tax=Colletotrichum chrysophilum TaxID=1836956 RepID=A0AAD9EMM0_9PEZI|nr:hypothetical protein CCHR01_03516 [Colletotrichum chrysophilum]
MTLKKSCLDLFLVWCFFLGCRPTRNQGAGTGRHGTKKKKEGRDQRKKVLARAHFALLDPSLIDRSRGKESVFFWAWFLFRAIGWFPVPSAALRSGRSTVTAQIREMMGFIVVGKGIGHLLCWEEQRQTTHGLGTHTQVALLMTGNTDTDTALGVGKGGGNTRIHAHTHNANSHFGIYLDFC